MFMMNVAGLRYSMAAGYLPVSHVYASLCNTISYNTRSGGGGNCTRGSDANRQGFSPRDADAKSFLDEAIRRGMGERGERSW
jgi:hypothetical protein